MCVFFLIEAIVKKKNHQNIVKILFKTVHTDIINDSRRLLTSKIKSQIYYHNGT